MEILERSKTAPIRRQTELLAGMNEDLRAPIQSVLGLARLLADNDGNNLTSQQVDFAQAIYAAGTDLLSLVDDIVDLARIEARQPALDVADQPFRELRTWLLRACRHAARDRHIGFEIVLAPDLPAIIRTDGKRLRHLLRNLVSLALRSVWGGQVTLAISARAGSATFDLRRHGGEVLAGKYAGGAVVAVCRELAHALGGDMHAANVPGEDLPVTLRLPLTLVPGQSRPPPQDAAPDTGPIALAPLPNAAPALSPRTRGSDEAVILIAEGNAQVAAVMLDRVRANGYQGAVATDLGTLRLLLRELAPEAVLIGGSLRDVDGWSALEMLRRDPQTRRMPMGLSHFDGRGYLCLQTGTCVEWSGMAPARLTAALDAAAGRRASRLLLAGLPERENRGELARCLDGRELLRVDNGPAALAALRDEHPDALVIGPALGGAGAMELVRAVCVAAGPDFRDLPLVFLESRPGGPPILEIAMLRRRSRLEDMLDETALHLAQALGRGTTARGATGRDASELAGRRALIVDDDIYNVYAMTGALEQQGMKVLLAESAREAVALLRERADIDAVLVDITMPGIDGNSAVHAVRAAHGGGLPIIAVTPHAMPGDRERCIGVGASDYVAKPINVEQLLALLRTWIARER